MGEFYNEQVLTLIILFITTCNITAATEMPSWTNLKCESCKAGQYMVTPCNEMNGKSGCKPCKAGTFNSKADLSMSCEDCRICEWTEVVESECTATSNTVCGCPSGTHWVSVGATGYCARK